MHFLIACLLTLLALPAGAVERVIHYHNDALGSPIAATDQDGHVVWRKSYAPYGQPIDQAAPNEPGYTGKFEEPDLGIQNFGARWYDPRIGRFLAIDPAGFDPQNPQSFNRYAYANNNPYKYVDPDGNSPLDAGFFIVDTVSFGLAVASGDPAAIQSTGLDLAASAVGLASPIPGTGLAIKAARAADKVGDAAKIAKGAANPVPETLARVIPGRGQFSTLGPPGKSDVFVTAADDIAGLNAKQIADRLTIAPANSFTVIKFPTPERGLASPVNRVDTGFVGGGQTAGGAREFVVPNGPIPSGASTEIIGP